MMADKLHNFTNSYEDIPITYNIGLDDKFNITCGMDIHKKSVPNDVEEELEQEDGWGDYINDESEHLFDELEALMYEIRNCRRGSYAGFGDTVPDLVEELNRLSDALTDLALRINYNETELTEKCGKKDAKLKENIPTEKSAQRELIGKLYLLNQMTNRILEYDRNFDFNEEENELVKKHLNDTLEGIKKIANKLNDTIGEDCSDKEESKIKTEVVNNKDGLVKDLQEALAKSAKLEKDNLSLQEQLSVCTTKEKSLNEELLKNKKALVKLSETAKNINQLKESLDEKTNVINSNEKIIKNYRSKLAAINNNINSKTKLEESLNESKNQVENITNKLNESNKKLLESKKVISKYATTLKDYRNSYIKSQARAYGISESSIRNNLKESYSIKDIDLICEELSEHKANMSKLPFRIDEDIRIGIKDSENEYIKKGFVGSDDDIGSENLLRMLDY